MQVNETAFLRLHEDHSEVVKDAQTLAIQANEALQNATSVYQESSENIKKAHKKELSERDCVIKTLVIVILAISTCAAYLGARLIINKC